VIGCPRSGTTLLYHMLLSAGGFAYYRSETHVFNSLWPRFGDLRLESNRKALLDVWLKSPMHIRSGLDESEARRATAEGFSDGGEFLRLVMDAMTAKQGARRWAETTPAHVLHMEQIRATISNALFVHVIRDGRDVALSLAKQGWITPLPRDRSKPFFAAGAFWRWIVGEGRRSGEQLEKSGCQCYMEVMFEDLVGKPQATLDRVGDFIAHKLDHEVILRNGVGSVSEPNTSFPGATGFSGRWKQELSQPDAQRLELMLGPTLDEIGYQRQFAGTSGVERLQSQFHVAPYLLRFGARQWLKSNTMLGRRFADLSLFAPPPPDAVHPMPPTAQLKS
jgi:hypothetical protein